MILCSQGSIAWGQTSSGTISGRVVDRTGAVVAGAEVDLVNQLTGAKVTTKVLSHGDFTFPDVQPGDFTVDIKAPGYKEFEKKNLRLSASERLSAGTITLDVGTVTESVTVSADITPIQTNSAERSGLLDTKQMDNLLTSGRDFTNLLRTMPGVVGGGGSTLPTINGVRNTYNSASIDGVTGSVREGRVDTYPNLDDISEVKVLSANYQAEYGKATGGSVINVVTKSGTQNFHGTLYYYMQNEALNANSWFNKYNGQSRSKSRHNTIGGNIGGPIFWPGHFNTNKNKLFFFYSMENLPNRTGGIKKYTVPTALERTGDFSQTYNSGITSPSPGTLIRIKDPASSGACSVNSTTPGPGCFPGNKIPANRINPSVLALMNLYPLPNFSDLSISANKYNYITNYPRDTSSHQEVFRIDYIPNERLHIFGRGELEVHHNNGHDSTVNPAPWLVAGDYKTTNPNFALDATYSITPTLVNEIVLGTSGWSENNVYPKSELDKLRKGADGYNLSQLVPKNNPLSLVPGIKFGLSSSADIKYDSRFPLQDQVRLYSLTDTVTKVWGRHIIKLGIDLQTDTYLQSHAAAGQPEGAFDFSRNTNNPSDSNFAYANALLGNFNNYTEPTNRFDYKPTNRVVDWYAQDQWKMTNKLTLDYGVRFMWASPSKLKTGANFVPAMFDPAKAPVLYMPTTKKVNGKPVALDPTTGEYVPAAYGGLFVPNTGDLTNGTFTVNTPGLPPGLVYGNGVLAAPRLGFAYDPFGLGKTVIRGGAGIFYNEGVIMGQEGDMSHNPPNSFNPEQFYGTVENFLTAGGLLGPPNVGRAIELHNKQTSTINTSLGIQQQVGFGTVLDVAYVGTFGRHLSGQQNINEVPYGAHFLPQNQLGGKPLPDNFYRKYPGYGTITYQRGFLTSNYNALQVQVTRRFHNGLEFGLAYTWAKSLDYTDSYDGSVPVYDDLRTTVYGPGGDDHRHNLVINYLYSLPKGSRIWSNFATRAILDNWQISGIASYLSGAPEQITFSTTDGADITGGGDDARPYISGDPNAGAPHTFLQWFNTSVVHRPTPVTVDPSTGQVTLSNGNAPKVSLFDPGVMNFDTALFKNIPVAEGRVAVQFRAETYNTLNHPEFNGIDTGAKFDPSGNQVNGTFGQINSSGGPRTMQLALRINF
ncbi:MAG TPA: carboxypeptidase regulatory-like domain-containing protein [Edaphobacter sp.]|nr:carboxypeptidase regulatory-like domain-containing protein [Edaphobacter sp.]